MNTESTLTIDNTTRRTGVSSSVLGMMFLIATEAMLFAGFIASLIVNRASAMNWQPADQPRLPVEVTFVNTLILLASGVAIFLHGRSINAKRIAQKVTQLSLAAVALGACFVLIQGIEWVKLLGYGLSTTRSLYGSFFYLIIGAHALHVCVGLILLFFMLSVVRSSTSELRKQNVSTVCSMYWYFVVGVWPILYYLVYLF